MQNVGAIFRNCDGAGFDKVICTWFTPYPPRKDISKTALWAEQTINWEFYEDPIEAIDALKKDGFFIIALEWTKSSQDYSTLQALNKKKICLIVWNEIKWVQEKLLWLSDIVVQIPMRWEKQSLNVSVAAWIAMYATNDV